MAFKFLLHITEPPNPAVHTPSPSQRVFATREEAESAAKEAVATLNRWLGPSVYMRDFKVAFEVIDAPDGQVA